MKRFTKTAILAIMLIIIPLKQWAQQPRQLKVSEFNITNIKTMEERVFVIHSILEQGYYCYKSPEKTNTVEVYIPNDAPNEMQDFDFFYDNLYNNDLVEFGYYDKDLKGELFIQWRQEIDDELYRLLYEDFTRGIATENSTCETALPFCTDNGAYTFPAGVNSGSPCGPNYNSSCSAPYKCSGTPGQSTNCLSTAPNPAFYYLKIANTGNLNIKIYSNPRYDIDFDCWGPFDDPITACSQLSCSNIVDCSYAGGSADEFCHINNAIPGKYYILLLTNYGNSPCNIIFENVGTGATDCGIMLLVNNDGPYCVGETIHLTAQGQAGATYSWTGPAGFSSTQQNPTRPNCTMNMAGTYTCTISAGGQTNTATTEVVIYPQPNANFTYTTVCQGSPTQFTSTSTTNPSGQQITSYQWDFDDGQTSTQQNPSHTYANPGTYSVTLTVACGNGQCTSSKTQNVTVYAEPIANAGPDQTIPYGTTAQLSGSGGAGTFNFHWEPANMVANPNAQNTQTVPLTADQTYTLTVTNPQGNCSTTDEVTIHINGTAMTVTAGPDISICQGGSGQIYVNAGGGTGNLSYSWTPTTGLSNPNIYNPIASPTQTTTYTCTVTDGQTSQNVSVTVTVNDVIVEDEYISICPDDVYHWHGSPYTGVGTYQFDTVTSQGCDKTIYLHLDHYPSYDETTREIAICYGETYTFYGTTYDHSIQTSHTDHTIHGCDSIVRLDLTVYPDNGITDHPVTVCPSQLPFYYEEDPNQIPLYAGDHLFHLEDIHGCDSVVVVQLTVSDYYIPPTQTEYVCYVDEPSFTWDINGRTYHSEGSYADTIPYADCEGIYRLDLHFMQIPEVDQVNETVCDSYTWPMTGETYTQSDTYYHRVSLYPFPCEQVHQLNLIVNKSDLMAENSYNGQCDSISIDWFGEMRSYDRNGVYTLEGETTHGCDSLMTITVSNMKYSPQPDHFGPNSSSTIWFAIPEDPNVPDTAMCAAVVTNTEFFSFQYDFFVRETGRSLWDDCEWTISKPSWLIESVFGEDRKSSTCKVYVADRDDDYVVLTATARNGCGVKQKKFYLRSSFLDVDENGDAPANVNIVPNPNNGQMRIDFENMEGRTSIRVYDMTGNQIDAFETQINSNHYNYDYNMKKYAEGIYFFVVSNSNRVLTKKVVVIH